MQQVHHPDLAVPPLTVIVPVYNGADSIDRCLDALVHEARACGAQVIVVDDGSTDATAAILARYPVTALGFRHSRGPSAARNLGAANAGAEILVFVDADVVVAPGTLQQLLDYLRGHPQCAAVFGSYDARPAAGTVVSRYRNLLHHYVHQHSGEVASHFWTGLGALRRSAFVAVGGFDEGRYARVCEDIELGYRLRQAGYLIRLDRAIQGTHLKRWTLRSMMHTDLRIRAVPWTFLLLERGTLPDDFSLGWSQRLSVLCAWLSAGCLALAPLRPALLIAAAPALLVFVVLNGGFLRMLTRQYGSLTGLAGLVLHLLYHLYSGAGFIYGLLAYAWQRFARRPAAQSERA